MVRDIIFFKVAVRVEELKAANFERLCQFCSQTGEFRKRQVTVAVGLGLAIDGSQQLVITERVARITSFFQAIVSRPTIDHVIARTTADRIPGTSLAAHQVVTLATGYKIHSAPAIGGVGLIEDVNDDLTGTGFAARDDAIVVIGDTAGHLGRSMLLRMFSDNYRDAGPPPPVDLEAERRNGDFVRASIAESRLTACHDVSDGGLAIALAEMAIAGHLGAEIDHKPEIPVHAWAFGEDQARYVVTTGDPDGFAAAAATAQVAVTRLGRVGGAALTLPGAKPISVEGLREAHTRWLPEYMGTR